MLALLMASACNPAANKTFVPVTSAYDCVARERPFTIITQTTETGLTLFIPEPFVPRTMHLPRVESASGEQYESEGITAWTKGKEAMFLIDTVGVSECSYDAEAVLWETAKLGGADFRGFGKDPDWTLEIREREQLEISIGEAPPLTAVALDIVTNEASLETVFQSEYEGTSLIVTLSGEACSVASDSTWYATTVLITYGESTYSGCGKALH